MSKSMTVTLLALALVATNAFSFYGSDRPPVPGKTSAEPVPVPGAKPDRKAAQPPKTAGQPVQGAAGSTRPESGRAGNALDNFFRSADESSRYGN